MAQYAVFVLCAAHSTSSAMAPKAAAKAPAKAASKATQQSYDQISPIVCKLKETRTTDESSQAQKDKVCEWWKSVVAYTNSFAENSAYRMKKIAVMQQVLLNNPYLQGLVDNGQADPVPQGHYTWDYGYQHDNYEKNQKNKPVEKKKRQREVKPAVAKGRAASSHVHNAAEAPAANDERTQKRKAAEDAGTQKRKAAEDAEVEKMDAYNEECKKRRKEELVEEAATADKRQTRKENGRKNLKLEVETICYNDAHVAGSPVYAGPSFEKEYGGCQ